MTVPTGIVVQVSLISLIAVFGLQAAETSSATATGLPLEGVEAEEFLRNAEMLECSETIAETLDASGGSRSGCKGMFSDGTKTLKAVFQDRDYFINRQVRISGQQVFGWKVRYHHEIAAYELDKLLGLGMVPPCVDRTFRKTEGSLCLWVEGAMSDFERRTVEKTRPPDLQDWNKQLRTIKMFMVLINDLGNPKSILIDGNWKLYKVSSSRAFHEDTKLVREQKFQLSQQDLDALRALDEQEVKTTLAPWLSKKQIKGLIARRDAIVEMVEEGNAQRGGS